MMLFKNERILMTNSFVIFYLMLSISTIIHIITNNLYIYIIANIICSMVLLYRVIYRGNKLKRLEYYLLNKQVQDLDQKMRGYQLIECVGILMFLALIFLKFPSIVIYFENNLLFCLITYSTFYFAFAGLSIMENRVQIKIILKIICILLSTLQGLIILILGTFVIISQFLLITQNSGINAQFIISESAIKVLIQTIFILEQFPIFTIVTIISSIILHCVYILSTPAYQLEELVFSFKMVNVLIFLLGIIGYFFSESITPQIMDYISQTQKLQVKFAEITLIYPVEFENYLKSFSKSNINNFLYLLFLPYTFGILVDNILLDIIKKRFSIKANQVLELLLSNEQIIVKKSWSIENLEKKYFYYGGDKWKFRIIKQIFIR
nr:hypothetical protein [Sedimentibacter sp.]